MLVEIDDFDVLKLEELLDNLKTLGWEHAGWAPVTIEFFEHFTAKVQGKKCEDCGADPAK